MSIYVKDASGNRKKAAGIGLPGPAGKSAYQYAVDGGFAGTEEQFADLQAGRSNLNLLDNWYFADPVNQRGQTEYTEPGYSIDRWTLQNITNAGLIVHDGYITLSATSNDGLLQRFEPSRLILGAEYTMSVLTHDGQLLTSPFVLSNQGVIENYAGTEWSGFHGYDPGTSTFLFYPIIAYGKAAQISIDLVAAKLELGSVQTLARKEGDAWVLNDPPPNKALELEKCQRYQYATESYYGAGEVDGEGINIGVNFPCTMRSTPTMQAKTGVKAQMAGYGGSGFYEDLTVSFRWGSPTSCSILINVPDTSKFVEGRPATARIDTPLLFDANL